MKLSDFIEANMESILAEWEAFARDFGALTSSMSVAALRDHAQLMLIAIVNDINAPQTADAQEAKGKGQRPVPEASPASAHGSGRQHDGFSLLQLTAEFRALRASVLRLWLPTIDQTDRESVNEMIRFNEALDEAIAESVKTFAGEASEARDVFLAMLGHDLRSPLHAIGLAAEYFARDEVEPERRITSARRVQRGVASMSRMVNDLLEFSRMQLGGAIPIILATQDLVKICHQAVDAAETANPECVFHFVAPTELAGPFDEDRLHQLLGNLLNNASRYRANGTTVTMTVERISSIAAIKVHNMGPAIPRDRQRDIFDPLVQLTATDSDADRPRSSAGLGLFIARRIVEAHGGRLTVHSSASEGTTFLATLPV